jgi:hypothetical protein
MVRIFSLAFVIAGTQLPPTIAQTCEEAVQWYSVIDTACKNDNGSSDCSATECQSFLSLQADEYITALGTCSLANSGYASLVERREELRISVLETATRCGVEVGFELTTCEVGMEMIFGIDANCPKACSVCEENCDNEVLRLCEGNECSRTPDSCAASGEGKCQNFLDKWSNEDVIRAAMAGIATCTSDFKTYVGYSDLIVQTFEVLGKECNGICGEDEDEGNNDFV